MKSLKVRFFPDHYQELVLKTLSDEHKLLYNQLLYFAKTTYQAGKLDFKDVYNYHKQVRINNNLTIHSHSAQNTYHQLIEAIKSYYSKRKTDPSARFPSQFKTYKNFNAFSFHYNKGGGGFKLTEKGFYISLDRKNNLAIDLSSYFSESEISNSNIKTLTITKEEDAYYAIFTYGTSHSNHNLDVDKFLSIDLGISSIACCYSNQIDPFSIQNNRYRKIEKTKEKLQGMSDKKKKGSRRWKRIRALYKKAARKQANKNKDFQHKASRVIINKCLESNIGTLIVGDIQTKSLTKSKKSNSTLNKSTQNQGTLSRFKTFLEYKAKNEGISFHLVDESYTSQTNCITGEISLNSDLSIREVELLPGFTIDRDLNSAINIAKRIKGKWFTQDDNFKPSLLKFHQMYMDNFSRLFIYDKIC